MAKKDTFLLVSLQEDEAKDVAQIITNKTCRKILDYLSTKESATESEISKSLGIAISTVHYNLEQLKKAKLVEDEEYHYSSKGKEVSHYSLASKYIIIAPKSTWGIKEKLRSILPVGLLTVGAAFFVNLFYRGTTLSSRAANLAIGASPQAAKVATDSVEEIAAGPSTVAFNNAVPEIAEAGICQVSQGFLQSPVFWFVIGAIFSIVLYLLIDYFRKRYKNNKNK